MSVPEDGHFSLHELNHSRFPRSFQYEIVQGGTFVKIDVEFPEYGYGLIQILRKVQHQPNNDKASDRLSVGIVLSLYAGHGHHALGYEGNVY